MLKSPRLFYDQFQKEDFLDFFNWYGNEKLMKMVAGRALSKSEAEARFLDAIKQNKEDPKTGFFSVRLQSNNQFLGIVKFTFLAHNTVEVGYGSLPEYWSQGFAKEMLEAIIIHAQSIPKISKLIGIVHPQNENSIKVLLGGNFNLCTNPEHLIEGSKTYILHI